MSVQRFDSYGYMPSPEGKNMRYDDHARIVAEATAEARAAERRHWEARFRNAEAAHAAALAGLMDECAWLWNEVDRWIDKYYTDSAPRTLTADDPEPAVGSIVMDRIGDPWRAFIGVGGVQVWASAGDIRSASWVNLHRIVGPVRLLHDGEDR